MPLDVDAGRPQQTSSWLIRLGFFIVVALVVAAGRHRLLELSSARQTFLSTVSHELRTPLASVVGFASILSEKAGTLTSDEVSEFATLIHKESSELSDVVDQYVLEGRLSDSALFIDTRPTDLRRVVEIVLEGLPNHLRDNRFHVDGSGVVCRADPLRLRQVLRAIFNNAVAYTPGRLRVEVIAEKSHGRISVIPDQALSRTGLDQIAWWTTRTVKAERVSTPLSTGLAVSRDLVRRMGGELHYDVNADTRYELRLPLQS